MTSYTPPNITVDGVIFAFTGADLSVLLIRRAKAPFAGEWALPGGYCSRSETTIQALDRVLLAKAGVPARQLVATEQLYTFDTPAAQDPRGHAVSVVYLALGRSLAPITSPTTEYPTFFPLHALPPTAYQHAEIIQYALDRLRGKITYTNIVSALLPTKFTFRQLQSAHEAILGITLDNRNFRKKYQLLGLIVPTTQYQTAGAHRPALLYRFKHQNIQALVRTFE